MFECADVPDHSLTHPINPSLSLTHRVTNTVLQASTSTMPRGLASVYVESLGVVFPGIAEEFAASQAKQGCDWRSEALIKHGTVHSAFTVAAAAK